MSHYDPASGREQRDGADSETNPSYVSPKPAAAGSGEPKWVKCVSTGYNWRAHDAGVLEVGKSYEVADYNQSEDHTEYALTEFPDKWFNALNFDPLPTPPSTKPTVTTREDIRQRLVAQPFLWSGKDDTWFTRNEEKLIDFALALLRAAETQRPTVSKTDSE